MTQGERVFEIRKSLNLTLDKFGEKLGVQKSAISKIEKGKAIGLTEGISDKQTDGYMTLTSEMKKDSYNKINELLKK